MEAISEVVIGDSLGIGADLDEAMAHHVDSYVDEWAATLADPGEARAVRVVRQRARDPRPRDRRRHRQPRRPRADRHRRTRRWRYAMTRREPGRASAPSTQLIPERGIAALVEGEPVALFLLDDGTVHAVGHRDPFSNANVMARGIVGSVGAGEDYRNTVASPMYKHVFDLATGECLTEPGDEPARLARADRRGPRRDRSVAATGSPAVTELGPVLAGLPDPGHRPASCRRAGRCSRTPGCRASAVAPALGVVPARRRGGAARVDPEDHRRPGRRRRGDDRHRLPWLAGHRRARRPGRRALHGRSPASGWSHAGPKARGALQAAGLKADWVAESETSAEIADFLLAEGVDHQRIAVQRHGAGDDGLNHRLTGGGASVMDLEVYRWGPPPDPDLLRETTEDLANGGYDAVLFTSAPSAAAWLTELQRLDGTDDALALNASGRLLSPRSDRSPRNRCRSPGSRSWCPERWRMGALVRLVIMELGSHAGVADAGRSAAGPRRCGDARPPGALPVPVRLRRAAAAARSRPVRWSRARTCCGCCPATPPTRTPPRWRWVGCGTRWPRPASSGRSSSAGTRSTR